MCERYAGHPGYIESRVLQPDDCRAFIAYCIRMLAMSLSEQFVVDNCLDGQLRLQNRFGENMRVLELVTCHWATALRRSLLYVSLAVSLDAERRSDKYGIRP